MGQGRLDPHQRDTAACHVEQYLLEVNVRYLSLGFILVSAGCPKDGGVSAPGPEELGQPEAPSVALIPRAALFGNATRASPRISPDGSQLGFLAPVDGVQNVWLGPVGDLAAAKPITDDSGRGIRAWSFLHDGEHLIYIQDESGDENWRIHAVGLTSGEDRVLTPEQPGVTARILGLSPDRPGEILVGLNDRDPQFHDVYLLDVASGELELVLQNDAYVSFVADDELNVRIASKQTPEGGKTLEIRDGDKFELLATFDQADSLTSGPISVTDTHVLLRDSRGRDTSALVSLELETGELSVLAASDVADVSDVLISELTDEVLAYSVDHLRPEWTALDEVFAEDLAAISAAGRGSFSAVSTTADEQLWVWQFTPDDAPTSYVLYDRASKAVTPLFSSRPELADAPLVPMHPVVIPARDGLELVSYLTLPEGADDDGDGRPEVAVPMVLLVHGGPWARDRFGYHPHHQLLANRGYAVLSVNFRGSTGFGKEFINAADLQWGAQMHDDLLDAVQWAVDQGVTQPDKVAIVGGSYGGYATLVGLTFTPQTFACGVDIVGPSNLLTLLETIPPYWKPMLELFATRVGDPRTEEGRALLWERSPLSRVEAIERPLLIAQGANDPRVKQAESDQIVEAMQQKGIPVTYALFPDEGHGFARPENNIAFWGVAESFLSGCLGGRAQPMASTPEETALLKQSSLQVPVGVEHVPGLAAALAEARPAAPAGGDDDGAGDGAGDGAPAGGDGAGDGAPAPTEP